MTDSSDETRALDVIEVDLGMVELDRQQLRLHAGGVRRLTAREVALLRYLFERSGEIVGREELQTEVWGYAPDLVTRAVDNTVRRLRGKLEEDPSHPVHLLTAHGEGYRLVPGRPSAVLLPTDGLPSASAASSPESRSPGDHRSSSLRGRATDLAACLRALDEGAPLLTILGPGGVGKTRLAREILACREGVFVDLSGTADEADVGAALARALGVRGDTGSVLAGLADRQAQLLLLDNCEQNLVGVSAWLGRMLAAVSGLRVVATSRTPLGLSWERSWRLEPLSLEASVALLQDRVRDSSATVPPLHTLETLAARLDGLPLALELAAARLGVLGPLDLLERLGRALDLLGRHGDDGRHGTLRATVAWSWSLLAPWAQTALARCSVFAGSFDALAAEAVLPPLGEGAPPVLDVLEVLRRDSLVHTDVGEEGRTRLRLLEGIRLFAAERLTPGDPAHLHHARWAASLPPERHLAMHPELLAAWSHARAMEPSLALRLAEALEAGFRAHGPPERWLDVVDLTATLPHTDPAGVLRAVLLRLETRHALGQEPELVALDEAIEAARLLDSAELLARAWLARARSWRARGAMEEALADYERAHTASRDRLWQARVGFERATLAADLHRSGPALAGYAQALDTFEALGASADAVRAEHHMSMVLSEEGSLDEARARSLRALRWWVAEGDARSEGIVASHLCLIELEVGDLSEAGRHLERARACHRSVGNRRFEGFAHFLAATLAHEREDWPALEAEGQRALRAFEEVGDRRFWALARARLGAGRALRGEVDQATEDLRVARTTLERQGVVGLVQGVVMLEGFVDLARGDEVGARARLVGIGTLWPTSFARLSRRQLQRAIDARADG